MLFAGGHILGFFKELRQNVDSNKCYKKMNWLNISQVVKVHIAFHFSLLKQWSETTRQNHPALLGPGPVVEQLSWRQRRAPPLPPVFTATP